MDFKESIFTGICLVYSDRYLVRYVVEICKKKQPHTYYFASMGHGNMGNQDIRICIFSKYRFT